MLQGGGALGSYQAGAYEALASSRYVPDWVCGISIGAINAALIAGNAPEHRVAQLQAFWNLVTQPNTPVPIWPLPPAIEIDGEFYWDGGLVSNTPLEYVITQIPRRSRLIFQVDLFPAEGGVPHSIEQVGERDKDIRYSSRTRAGTDTMRMQHDLRHDINTLLDLLPAELRHSDVAERLYTFGCVTTMDIVLLIDRAHGLQGDWQGASKDYEFSPATMQARWARGRADAQATLSASPWLAPMPPELGARTFDVLRPRATPVAAY